MIVACLDLEGVLVPEIWINVAERTGIAELRRTTRDEPDYDKLMRGRLDLLAAHRLGRPDIQEVIAGMERLLGAVDPRSAPPCSNAGLNITTGIARTRASVAPHPSVDSSARETTS